MAYGLPNGNVTDDVTWPPKVLWGSTVVFPSDSLASYFMSLQKCLVISWLLHWSVAWLIDWLLIDGRVRTVASSRQPVTMDIMVTVETTEWIMIRLIIHWLVICISLNCHVSLHKALAIAPVSWCPGGHIQFYKGEALLRSSWRLCRLGDELCQWIPVYNVQ